MNEKNAGSDESAFKILKGDFGSVAGIVQQKLKKAVFLENLFIPIGTRFFFVGTGLRLVDTGLRFVCAGFLLVGAAFCRIGAFAL